MSIFFGIFRPQGGSVDLEAFEDMRKASDRDGFDGMSTHVEEKIAMGHLMLRVSPEDEYDKQPLKSSCGRYVLVGHFRLDYRDELGDKIGLTQSQLEKTPDSALAMMAYQKWGEKCVHHIEGDWVFVIYERELGDIFFFRDPCGCSALFYTIKDGAFYFSTNPNWLILGQDLSAAINFNHLIRLNITGFWKKNFGTLHSEVLSVEHASINFLEGNLVKLSSIYWSPTTLKSTSYRYEIDYAIELFSLFQRSINSRVKKIRGEVGLFLSSGLDSTAIAYLASSILSLQNKHLKTFTSFPNYLEKFSDSNLQHINEMPFVKNFVNDIGNIESHFLNFSDLKISKLISSDRTSDIFNPIITPNTFWIEGIIQEASKRGSVLMLNGQLGNFTISCANSKYYLMLFLRLQFKLLFCELMTYSRKQRIGFVKSFYRKIIREFVHSVVNFKANLKSNIVKRLDRELLFEVDKNRKREFVDLIADRLTFSHFFDSKRIRKHFIQSALAYVGINWYREAEGVAMCVTDPTADPRIINFSLTIPEELYSKNGLKNSLYKLMMQDLLPNYILNAPFKKHQSADIHFRVIHDDGLINLYNSLSDFDKGTFSFQSNKIRAHYNTLTSENKILDRVYASQRFLNGISLVLFLRNAFAKK